MKIVFFLLLLLRHHMHLSDKSTEVILNKSDIMFSIGLYIRVYFML